MKRRSFLRAGLAIAGALAPAPALAAGALEKPKLAIGIPNNVLTMLPLYVAAGRTWRDEGLDVDLRAFRGGGDVTKNLASGEIDVAVASPIGLLEMIEAGQPVIGFYQGFYQGGFSWMALPSIKTWAGLKGKRVGISTPGSMSDAMTRYMLQKHNVVPEQDVQLVNVGGGPGAYPMLKAGTLDAAFLESPFTWEAADDGFTLLGTQEREISAQWPIHIFFAKTAFLNDNPNTVVALLRAHVAAIRLARANRALAVDALVARLGYARPLAERVYDEIIGGYNERGTLPERAMPAFWKIAMQAGTVTAPWPESKFLDPRYIRTFKSWAPRS